MTMEQLNKGNELAGEINGLNCIIDLLNKHNDINVHPSSISLTLFYPYSENINFNNGNKFLYDSANYQQEINKELAISLQQILEKQVKELQEEFDNL